MKGNLFPTLFLIAFLIGFSGMTWAEEGETTEGARDLPSFEEADKDGDGQLSLEEAKAVGISQNTFEKEDLDGDGYLTEYDYKYGVK